MDIDIKQSSPGSQQGIVLLEALIAILIFSMGILAVVGLQAAMIKNTSDARFRSEAGFIAQQRIGLIWSDPANAGAFLEASPGTDISTILPGGTRTTEQISPGEFRVTVNWMPPSETGSPVTHTYVMVARVAGG
ncbi:MAG: prepilin-type cleavage/methylation domain-containing protein [Nitrosomonadales bacterium]|nr:MAG: prepilin-type cleavage/methylation domain-containing protein [Nitrosomonadales bacterium]